MIASLLDALDRPTRAAARRKEAMRADQLPFTGQDDFKEPEQETSEPATPATAVATDISAEAVALEHVDKEAFAAIIQAHVAPKEGYKAQLDVLS